MLFKGKPTTIKAGDVLHFDTSLGILSISRGTGNSINFNNKPSDDSKETIPFFSMNNGSKHLLELVEFTALLHGLSVEEEETGRYNRLAFKFIKPKK